MRSSFVSQLAYLEDEFVAIDVEISSRSPIAICAIGAVRVRLGTEIAHFSSLVMAAGPIRYGRIHGLKRQDLLLAPPWPSVWRQFLAFATSARQHVAFNAEFDRGALLSMCASYDLRPPPMRFVCALKMAESRLGRKLDLAAAITALGLTFPGRHHDPLADARAAAAVALACTTSPPG